MAHGIRRLGRDRGGAEGCSGAVRRRPLHGAGQDPGGRIGFRVPPRRGRPAKRVDRAEAQARRQARYDSHLHTPDAVARFAAACEKAGAGLVAVDVNPIDALWLDRPAAPVGAITPHKLRFAGENVSEKIARVRQAMKSSAGLMISDPHNLAWLFNIRGSDVSYTPLPLGFAYLPHEGRAVVFLDGRKLTPASRDVSPAGGDQGAGRPPGVCRGPGEAGFARRLRRRHRAGLFDPGDGARRRQGRHRGRSRSPS